LCAFAKIRTKFPKENVAGFEGSLGRPYLALLSSANEYGKPLGKMLKADVWSIAVNNWLIGILHPITHVTELMVFPSRR